MHNGEGSTELEGTGPKKFRLDVDEVTDEQTQHETPACHTNGANGDSKQTNGEFEFSSQLTLEKIRQLHSTFVKQRNWDKYHKPQNVLLALVGEVGELAEVFQWKADVENGLPGWSGTDRQNVEDELSDVLIYLVRLADRCHVDLPAAVLRKMEKNAIKYPADKVYGSSKKYTEYKDDS